MIHTATRGTCRYRASPIYLARVPVASVGTFDAYEYAGRGGGWGPMTAAVPVIGGGGAGNPGSAVGELSAAWTGNGTGVVVCFCDYTASLPNWPRLYCASSARPGAPFGAPVKVMDGGPQPWYAPGWGGIYGGYVVGGGGGGGGAPPASLLLSLWVPYRVFAVPLDLPSD